MDRPGLLSHERSDTAGQSLPRGIQREEYGIDAVALHFPRLGAPMYTHEKVTLSVVAKSIARLNGHRFAGEFDPKAHVPAHLFFVPSDTLILDEARDLGIHSSQETFKLLGEKEIRTRVVGNDITDSSHWVSYLRPDGVLLSDEMGRKWTGTWKIHNNRLCMSNPNLDSPDCSEVWMSGANIRMRANKEQETFDAVVEKHKAR
jgi:hypothetical protein